MKVKTVTSETFEEEFFKHVKNDTNGCWIWTGGTTNSGRPRMNIDGKAQSVQPFIFRKKFGFLKPNAGIQLQCTNKLCVNSDHFDIDGTIRQSNVLKSRATAKAKRDEEKAIMEEEKAIFEQEQEKEKRSKIERYFHSEKATSDWKQRNIEAIESGYSEIDFESWVASQRTRIQTEEEWIEAHKRGEYYYAKKKNQIRKEKEKLLKEFADNYVLTRILQDKKFDNDYQVVAYLNKIKESRNQ